MEIEFFPPLRVGDRVMSSWRDEQRLGEVVEEYLGKPSPSNNSAGIELLAVKWDDTGEIERGYIRKSGSLHRYIVLSPILLPGVIS